MTALALAFAAGLLSILSPCVLPLVPIVLGAAATAHPLGALALAAGLALSFTGLGLLLALAGFGLGIDAGMFRLAAAVIMAVLGAVLLIPSWQARLASAGGPLSGWADRRFGGFASSGLGGQLAIGLLLGAVWSPCVGPTLGAASLLASQGQDLPRVMLTMATFGVGAGLPLVLLGLLSRSSLIAAFGISRHSRCQAFAGMKGLPASSGERTDSFKRREYGCCGLARTSRATPLSNTPPAIGS